MNTYDEQILKDAGVWISVRDSHHVRIDLYSWAAQELSRELEEVHLCAEIQRIFEHEAPRLRMFLLALQVMLHEKAKEADNLCKAQ